MTVPAPLQVKIPKFGLTDWPLPCRLKSNGQQRAGPKPLGADAMARFGSKSNTDVIETQNPEGMMPETDTAWPEQVADTTIDPNADYTDNPAPENMTETPAENETPEVLNGVTEGSRRGRPKLADLPALSADDLGGGMFVPENEWAENPVAEKAGQIRDAAQIKVDELVKQVHDAWVKADKPGARTSPRARYEVKPEHAPSTRAMLTRAGTLHKVKVTPVSKNLPNGMVAIVFTVRDRDPKPL